MTAHGLRALALAAALALAGCLGPDSPEELLQAIKAYKAKNLPMTEKQIADVEARVARGRAALAAGDTEQAEAAFDAALAILKRVEDAALYNKAD